MAIVAHDHNWAGTDGGWACTVAPCTAKCSDLNLISNPPPNTPGLDVDDIVDIAFRATTGAPF